MKRGKKLFILSLVFVLLLAAAFAAGKLNPELNGSGGEDAGSVIFTLDPGNVAALSVNTMDFEKDGEDWRYTGDSAFPLNTGYIQSMLDALSSISASKTIEAPEDLSQYGLDAPEYSIRVDDGSETEILIGRESSMGGERYLSLGDGNVYLVDAGITESFSYELMDMAETELIPAMSDISRFTVRSGGKSYQLCYLEDSGLAYSDEYVWFYKDGEDYLTLDTALADSFIRKVSALSWDSCVSYNAGGDALAEYGLDVPQVTATVEYTETVQVETNATDTNGDPIYDTRETEKSFTLEIGDYIDGKCYARIAGSHMVYLIDGSICDSLLHVSYESLQPDEVLIMDWDEVESVDIGLDGETYTVKHGSKTVVDEDGTSSTESCWTLDGEKTDIQTVFDRLTSLVPTGRGAAKTPELGATLSFVFHRSTESFPQVELIFYQYDSSSCLVSLNGEARLLVSLTDITALADSLTQLIRS